MKNDWNYFDKVVSTLEINSTTNSIESINKKLKAQSTGKITFSKACEILVAFKSSYISEYEFTVVKGNFNPRSLQTIRNNNVKIKLVLEFNSLDFVQKCISANEYAFKLGAKKPSARFLTTTLLQNDLMPSDSILDNNLNAALEFSDHLPSESFLDILESTNL